MNATLWTKDIININNLFAPWCISWVQWTWLQCEKWFSYNNENYCHKSCMTVMRWNLIVSRQIVFDMLTQRRPISYKLKTQIALVCPSFHFSAHYITKTSLFNFQAKQVPWILANAQETMKSQATHISNHITMA